MRRLLPFFLLAACSSGDSSSPQDTPSKAPTPKVAPAPTPKVAPAPTPKVAPAPTPKEEPVPVKEETVVVKASWDELVNETVALKKNWEQLPAAERFSYYQKWIQRTDTMVETLLAAEDWDALSKFAAKGEIPKALRVISAEGEPQAIFISELWLLNEFKDLPEDEKAYLKWISEANMDNWFAEGQLNVEISLMTQTYSTGIALLEKSPTGFRATALKKQLTSAFDNIINLLSNNPGNKAKKAYRKSVEAVFLAVSKGSLHKQEAEAFIKEMPSSKVPYDYNQVQKLRNSLKTTK